MRSRGPIIRTLEIVAVFSSLVATGALVFALVVFSRQLTDIQIARERAALDTCRVIDKLVARKFPHSRTPLVESLGLTNCQRYALSVRHGTLPVVRAVRNRQ